MEEVTSKMRFSEIRRANESRLLQVEFYGGTGAARGVTFGTIGKFTTTDGIFWLFAYQVAVIDMGRSLLYGIDGTIWFLEYRGIPFMGRTGYLTELKSIAEVSPWRLKIDPRLEDAYRKYFEIAGFMSMEHFDDRALQQYLESP